MPRSSHPREQLTATGIRIVGQAAAELVQQARGTLSPPPPGDILWIARMLARPRLGHGSPIPAMLQVVTKAIRADWDACPDLTREGPVTRPAGRFHGASWQTDGDVGSWRGELLWRHPHPILAGIPCTTQLVIDEQQSRVTVTLAVATEGGLIAVRGPAGAGQLRPKLLDLLRKAVTLTADGQGDGIRWLDEDEIEPFVRDVMLGEQREYPVAVLAPREDGGYLVEPELIAGELFGLAPLHVMTSHSCTFRLTDAVGDRRLSAYWGALRVYRQEFSCADSSTDHWLLMRDRIEDPVERAALVGRIAQAAVARLCPVDGVASRRAAAAARHARSVPADPLSTPTSSPTTVDADADAEPTWHAAAGDEGTVPRPSSAWFDLVSRQLADLGGTLAHLAATQERLADELSLLRTATAVRAGELGAVDRRLAEFEQLLRPDEPLDEAREEPSAESADPTPQLVDFVREAAGEYIDHLLVLDSAERAARESPYEDPSRVAAVLEAMAQVSQRRQEGRLATGLRAAFQEVGIDYRSGIADSTSDRLRRQYRFVDPDGREFDCFEHIAIGGTYNPRRCLRIYFSSKAPAESRFVIGHVGRHLQVITST